MSMTPEEEERLLKRIDYRIEEFSGVWSYKDARFMRGIIDRQQAEIERLTARLSSARVVEKMLKAIANIHESDGVGANPLLFCIETSEQALASLRAAIPSEPQDAQKAEGEAE